MPTAPPPSRSPLLDGAAAPSPPSQPVAGADREAVRRYEAQLRWLGRADERLSRWVARLDRTCARFSRVRMALALAGAAAVAVALTADSAELRWAAAGAGAAALVAFVAVARRHGRALGSLRRFRVWRQMHRERAARLRRDWAALPPAFAGALPDAHPFGADLHIVGPRSVHHLVSTAVTEAGARRLAEWLLAEAPSAGEIAGRRRLVAALVERPLFRDRLPLRGREARAPVDLGALTAWLARAAPASLRRALSHAALLSGLTYALLALSLAGLLPPLWLLTFALYVAVSLWHVRTVGALADRADGLVASLASLHDLLQFVESRPQAGSPALAELCAPFWSGAARPSALLRRARRVAGAAAYQRSGLLWVVLNALGPWDLVFAQRLERLRETLQALVPGWLDRWASLEAAASLAQFADLDGRPLARDPAPGEAVLEARGMVHPLLAIPAAVPNSVAFGTVGEALVVTGSNMAGKSTFLRALGTNLALAQAGGPVTASSLACLPFRMHAVLNVADSVQDGVSYFYAEVRRLKALLDAIERPGPPVFFLIDEILRGTNNRERFQGSSAYIRAIARRGTAVGLLSTHDLDLARLDVPGVSNVHFSDRVEGGTMVFDYALREGPSETTNALRVLEAAGLPTDPA